ncbi:MmcB family DNA repair protein [Qipengyuania nanhaisediminis]|uniref:MmcB family DNA repair protein n=1 Tax=Qipengyuania nanhaisediminis TaxID=604088 RepID=UPI0038B2BB18
MTGLAPRIDSLSAPATGPASAACPAGDVARGIMRLFARNNIWCVSEMALRNGRRADLMGIDAKGLVVIVEIKVARGDLLGDAKWPDYLDYCDRFFWGVPPGLDRTPLESEGYRPDCCGVIVADAYDGEIVRPAPLAPLAAARRKVQVEALARVAMRRHTALIDPDCGTVLTGA